VRRLTTSIAAALNVRAGEGPLLSLILGLFLLKGICDVFFATSASTLFLETFGTEILPYVYIGSAVVVTILGLLYSRMTSRFSTESLLQVTLVFVVASTAAFHVSLAIQHSKWGSIGLMIWREVLYMLLNATFWARVGTLFDVRQGKRLFPVMAAGEIVSAGIGGISIPFIVNRIGALHLLFFVEVSMALCVVVAIAIDRVPCESTANADEDVRLDARPLSRLIGQRYVALFFAVSVLSYVVYFMTDFNFYAVVNDRFPSAESLAAFFGVFYAVLNALNLALNGFFAGRLLIRYGIAVGLLAVPICVGAGTVAAFASFGLGLALFWPIVATKLMDEMLRGAFLYPTYKILYQPLPRQQRLRVQALRDSIVEPMAMGLSGGMLLALTSLLGFGVLQLSYGLAVVLVVFSMLSVLLRREYVVALGRSLSRRRPIDDSALLSNASSLAVIRQRLQTADAAEAIDCLGLLKTIDPEALRDELPRMLTHPRPEVRQDVLRRLREETAPADVRALQDVVRAETVPNVLGEAVRTLCSYTRAGAYEQVAPLLTHQSPEVRAGVVSGLLRYGTGAGVAAASDVLRRLVLSAEASDRMWAARILTDAESPDFVDLLRALLGDADLNVARAAITAAGRLKTPALMPAVFDKLSVPHLRECAASAVVEMGDVCIPMLEAAAEETCHRATGTRMIRILARIRSDAGLDALVAHIRHPDENVRHVVLEALAHRRFAATGARAIAVCAALEAELSNAAWLLACLRDLGVRDAVDLSASALRNDYSETRDRVLLLLSFVHPSRTFLNARALLLGGSVRQRAKALETVDNLLAPVWRATVLPLLDDVPDAERLARLQRTYPQSVRSVIERLSELIFTAPSGISSWSRACAVYEAARFGAPGLLGALDAATRHPDALVRETAEALYRTTLDAGTAPAV
jgi:ATP:ADP antiporter, AAA family